MSKASSYLEGLNTAQHEAVTHGSSPLLVLAGAGSGKTRVLTSRIAYLIEHYDFKPYQILALTFTNKVAKEMKERVAAQYSGDFSAIDGNELFITTFHSFGAWFLRRFGHTIGLKRNFAIYDDKDSLALLKKIIGKDLANNEIKSFAHCIARAKEEGLTHEHDLSHLTRREEIYPIFQKYTEALKQIGNVDFSDLINLPLHILNTQPEVKNTIHRRFKAILVDEYQDTNVAQFHLLQQLYHKQSWLSVVGDDDQSIYGFRGAMVENILKFPDLFQETKVITLSENYRSTPYIIKAANDVIANNENRMAKTMAPVHLDGEKLTLHDFDSAEEEATFCAARLQGLPSTQTAAILYRTNAQSRALEQCFTKLGIKYRLIGNLSFFKRQEVKDVLSYLILLSNPNDYISFLRIINKPARSLGPQSVGKIFNLLDESDHNVLTACQLALESFTGNRKKGLSKFIDFYKSWQNLEVNNLGELIECIINDSGLLKLYQDIDDMDSTHRVANLNELLIIGQAYQNNQDDLISFLEKIELNQNVQEDEQAQISLITVHNTKGLEYDHVIITGMEDGLFPSQRSTLPSEIEEERRLFYVAMTRAKTVLDLSYSHSRFHFGHYQYNEPSRFLQEIPSEYIQNPQRLKAVRKSRQEPQYIPVNIPIKQKKLNQKLAYPKGTKIYHDDYGEGYVLKSKIEKNLEVINIRFVSGKQITLIPEFQSHSITKIEENW